MKPNMFDSLPSALLMLFLGLCVLWLIGQALRRFLAFRKRRPVPSLEAELEARRNHEDPAVSRATATVSTIPDAADVLALKAAIDNLARQVAALEKRLSTGQSEFPSLPTSPSEKTVERRSDLPPVTPDHRI
jgi:Na+-transporting methylmalonyl-CoA/oxaloacetate decarboxylase gamma subunit